MENVSLDALQTEVEFYRQNQTIVEAEIRSIITDNQKLSQQVSMLLKEKLENAHNIQNPQYPDNELEKELEEFRRQVTLLTKERDSLHVLWQTSQKTIYALETELKTYQNYDDNSKQNTHINRRDIELKLETSLADYIELESKHKELQTKHATSEQECKSKEKELQSYKEHIKQLENEHKEMTKALEEVRINLEVEKKNNIDTKTQLTMCQKESIDLIRKEAEAKTKVAEALQLFDVVSAQKKEAYKKVAELAGELTNVKRVLANVEREMESKWRKEMDEIKEKYNEKVSDMLQHIRNLDAELVEKGMLLNKVMRENQILQNANESYMKQQKDCIDSVDPKIALAEQRMETLFKELVASERRNIQLVCEKQCLAIDMQRTQDVHAREIKRRDWEESLLKSQVAELKLQVEHLQKSLEETHGMVSKLQNMLSSRTELNLKMVSTKEEELAELNKHLENQMELSKKWKQSYVEMSDKLKGKLEDLHKENRELRSKLNPDIPEESS